MPCRNPQLRIMLATSGLCVLSLLAFVSYSPVAEPSPGQSDEDGGKGDALAPGPFPYIIDETNKCPEGKAGPFLVLLITIEAHQLDRRDAIRQTWGDESQEGVVRLFLLGGEKEGDQGRLQQKALELESLRHHDIIQQDFMDTYLNLTTKTLMGLNWVARRCPRAAFVMKTDADMFVNTEYLGEKLLKLEPGVENYITGSIQRGARPFRDKSSKWYTSEEEYPGKTYPDYVSGGGYVFSGDLAAKIYTASLSLPRFKWEDVHVGICLAELGIEPTPSLPGEFSAVLATETVPWSYDRYSHLVAAHRVSPSDMLDYWTRLQQFRF